jgi:hypothetical protein
MAYVEVLPSEGQYDAMAFLERAWAGSVATASSSSR